MSVRAVDFISEFDPDFRTSIRPATDGEIERLQNVVGRSLPRAYHEFLRSFGNGMDWVEIFDANFDIQTITEYYEKSTWRPPDQYLLIGLATEDPFFHIHLQITDNEPPRVVAFPDGSSAKDFQADIIDTWAHPIAGSLDEMMCTYAYRRLKLPSLPFHAKFAVENVGIDDISTMTKELGFDEQWFSNAWTHVGNRHDAALIAFKPDRKRMTIDLACSTIESAESLDETLNKKIENVECISKIHHQ